jgi:hypothetical protein
LLLDAKNLCVWKAHHDFIRSDIDREVLSQVEAGFNGERSVKFHTLGTSCPRVLKFMVDFDAPRHNRQFARWRGLFQVDAIVDGNPGLQMGDVDEGGAQIFANSFHLTNALMRGPHGPGVSAIENEADQYRDEERDQS